MSATVARGNRPKADDYAFDFRVGAGRSEVEERRTIARFSRDELEDKHIRLYEEHLILKKKERNQEEKMKRMATKLLRLTADKKEEERRRAAGGGHVLTKYDPEMKDLIEDLQSQIRKLVKDRDALKDKLTLTKQQLMSQSGKRRTAFDHVKPRISTGLSAKPPPSQLSRPLPQPSTPRRSSSGGQFPPRYGHSLLEEARKEKSELEAIIGELQEHIQILEDEGARSAEYIQDMEIRHEREILKYKEQLSMSQRSNIQEDVGLIRLQREVKDRSAKFDSLQAQYLSLEKNMNSVKASHAKLLEQLEELNRQLEDEKARNVALQTQLRSGTATEQQIADLHDIIADLRSEKQLLKQTNEKLIKSAFDAERERQHKEQVLILQTRIEQLEASHKTDLQEKNHVLDLLDEERGVKSNLESELRQRNLLYYQTKQEHDELSEKMKFFTKESAVDVREIEEALVLIKTRKEKGQSSFDFLEKLDDSVDAGKDQLRRDLAELRCNHAETVGELDKTRRLLSIQHKINKDYTAEVDTLVRRMENVQRDCDARLKEYAQMVDVKAARIKKLEGQLHDIAYGTRQYRIERTAREEADDLDLDGTVALERGQNLLEINVGHLLMSDDAISQFEDPSDVATVVSFGFYDFDLQFSPVIQGVNPKYDFTAQYVVQVDDFFLHYLQRESSTLEVHRGVGTEYETLAAGQIRFQDLLESAGGRVYGQVQLTGVYGEMNGSNFGSIDYWIRLRVPMDQALRLFKERTKALGYIVSDGTKPREAPPPETTLVPARVDHLREDYNELSVTVVRCTGLASSREGVAPAAYVVYKFYDFADHDTTVAAPSVSPTFDDTRVYPVLMNAELDSHLKTQGLDVYVFDDLVDDSSAHVGTASIPLLSLARDNDISGTFELRKVVEMPSSGMIEMKVKWNRPYRVCGLLFPAIDDEDPDGDDVVSSQVSAGEDGRDVIDKETISETDNENRHLSASPQSLAEENIDDDDNNHDDDDLVTGRQDVAVVVTNADESHSLISSPVPDEADKENDIDDEAVAAGGDAEVISDEDDLVVSPSPTAQRQKHANDDVISVEVVALTLNDDAPFLDDDSIKQLFVEYKFLNCDPELLETPFSLPKRAAGVPMSFNFRRIFRLDDPQFNYRDELVAWMQTTHPSAGRIPFTIVSEPPAEDDQNSECVDVGSAHIDLFQVLKDGRDLEAVDIDVHGISEPNLVTGCLTVSVEAISALRKLRIQKE